MNLREKVKLFNKMAQDLASKGLAGSPSVTSHVEALSSLLLTVTDRLGRETPEGKKLIEMDKAIKNLLQSNLDASAFSKQFQDAMSGLIASIDGLLLNQESAGKIQGATRDMLERARSKAQEMPDAVKNFTTSFAPPSAAPSNPSQPMMQPEKSTMGDDQAFRGALKEASRIAKILQDAGVQNESTAPANMKGYIDYLKKVLHGLKGRHAKYLKEYHSSSGDTSAMQKMNDIEAVFNNPVVQGLGQTIY